MSNLTPEQLAAQNFAIANPSRSMVIDAKAGSGKTTWIVRTLSKLRGETALLAYNKAIANELKLKTSNIPGLSFTTTIGTCHSFGLGILRPILQQEGIKFPKVEGGKLHFLLKRHLDAKPSHAKLFNERRAGTAAISRLVSAAKNSGVDLPGPAFDDNKSSSDDFWLALLDHFSLDMELEDAGVDLDGAIDVARALLDQSNRQRAQIDFDDMIYLPLLLQPQSQPFRNLFDNVIIDEAQDISATRRELARRSIKPETGRMIAVGDPNQAIYGFTGADADSIPNIIREMDAEVFPMSICFRCAPAVIAEAQVQVPSIVAAPGREGGKVGTFSIYDWFSGESKIPTDTSVWGEVKPPEPAAGDAILCRLNRPNVAVALELLRLGKRCKIEGRDLGGKLLSHYKAAFSMYAHQPLQDGLDDLDEWKAEREQTLLSKGKFPAVALFVDEVDCLTLMIERTLAVGGNAFTDLEKEITQLFSDDVPASAFITLSSVHKAKGREWPRVFILGPDSYMPFHVAQKDWERKQEQNLIYVAKTRAEEELYYVHHVKQWLDDR